MHIVVNGEPRQCQEGISVSAFIASLSLKPETLVVELNGEILDSSSWKNASLRENDMLELLQFVGGG